VGRDGAFTLVPERLTHVANVAFICYNEGKNRRMERYDCPLEHDSILSLRGGDIPLH
jgi:hypothetical protein